MNQQQPGTVHAGSWGLWGLHCPQKSHSLPLSPLRNELSPRLPLPHFSPISTAQARSPGVTRGTSLFLAPHVESRIKPCVSSLHEVPASNHISPRAPEGTAAWTTGAAQLQVPPSTPPPGAGCLPSQSFSHSSQGDFLKHSPEPFAFRLNLNFSLSPDGLALPHLPSSLLFLHFLSLTHWPPGLLSIPAACHSLPNPSGPLCMSIWTET